MTRVLVVDDHAATREPLARLLRYEGYETAGAANGAEALRALDAARPDVVLLDLMMPKMDGLGFLEAVRREERYRHLPVIVMTAVPEGSQLERVRRLEGCDVLPKARFTVEELLARIQARVAAGG